jgi:hypothetical protein
VAHKLKEACVLTGRLRQNILRIVTRGGGAESLDALNGDGT